MLEIAGPEFVNRVALDERNLRWMLEDNSSANQLMYRQGAVYFKFEDKGFVMFRKATVTMWECHICMQKGASNFYDWCFECLDEMRNQGVKKFVAPISEWNKPAIRLVKKLGFKEEGRISDAFVKNGKPKALIFMGAN